MKDQPEVLAIIPARGGSKGIPRKNIKPLGGKPLIEYTIKASLSSTRVGRTVVSTEDEEIAAIARSIGAEIPFMRPASLATDSASSISVVRHCLDRLRENEAYRPDIVVLLQATSPFRDERHIDQAIELFTRDQNADSCVSVVPVPHQYNPYSVMKLNGDYLEPFLPWDQSANSRQLKPLFYARNGAAMYILREPFFQETGMLYGGNIIPYYMDKIASLDLDDLVDFEMAECIVQKKNSSSFKFES